MTGSIEDTLRELDKWYNETPGGTNRPKLLSKLATLELCGWVEAHLDAMIERTGKQLGLDANWVQKSVIRPNYGMSYTEHLRPMLAALVGEAGMCRVETAIESKDPGVLETVKTELGSLWTIRGHLAHTTIAAGIPKQVTINAPSWSLNRQRVTAKALDKFEAQLVASV